MKRLVRKLRLEPGAPVDLGAIDPADTCGLGSKDKGRKRLAEEAERIGLRQAQLFAEGRRALLVVLQGMDTSGKDGTIRSVFRDTSPLGLRAHSFTRPTADELAHDFLWRVHRVCPKRGEIGVFNRSHYEDVLAAHVRGTVTSEVVEHRYDQINAFEGLIASSTVVLKIMLHISRDEQRARLQARLDTPEKRWKFDPGDLEDRGRWDEYLRAYEAMLSRCAGEAAPWYVVPSDHKWVRNAVVATLVRHTLDTMDPRFPEPDWNPADVTIAP